jgi:1D-myo-inositol 3-kinase
VNPQADLLLVGHVSKDLTTADPNGEYCLGGVVSFASATALRLGRTPTVITRADPTVSLCELLPEVKVHVLPSPTTTTFANLYTDGGRIQYCYTPASPIRPSDIPWALHQPRVAILGPIMNEVCPEIARLFGQNTVKAALPQGWMRHRESSGRIYSRRWEYARETLPYLDVVILSHEDLSCDPSQLELFIDHVPLVILTCGANGSIVYERQKDGRVRTTTIPTRPALEVDPTGAGDIFATAFLLRYEETGDVVHAAQFASVTASYGVEAYGFTGIPSRQEVLTYLEAHPEMTVTRAC